jgi:RNA polymerase sigma factor (sigma-70 family)
MDSGADGAPPITDSRGVQMPVFSAVQDNDAQLSALLAAARRGDNVAWEALITRFDRMLRSIARSYRLNHSDVDDVVQVAWTQLYRHIDSLREPHTVAGWLATTTRREAMRVLQKHVAEQLCDDPDLGGSVTSDGPDAMLIAAEERALLARAVAALPGGQRELLTLLSVQPDARYQHISSTLKMPVGSIGPTRARALTRLSCNPELREHRLGVI